MRPQNTDQIGICSWSLHPQSPAELADRVEALGLSRVQIELNRWLDDPATWEGAGAYLADRGIQLVSGMFRTVDEDYSSLESIRRTGGVVPDEHWAENWRIAKEVARVAEKLELRLVSTHAGFIPEDAKDPRFSSMLYRLGRIAHLFADHGLVLLFETGQETAAGLLRFLKALESTCCRNIGVNFDPANMILYDKGKPAEALRELMPRLKQVHLKDAVRTQTPGQWGAEVPIGEGDVDWQAFFQVLAEGDYAGQLVIERESAEHRVDELQASIQTLSGFMSSR